jgi:putative ABC transport system substrate-binding protein
MDTHLFEPSVPLVAAPVPRAARGIAEQGTRLGRRKLLRLLGGGLAAPLLSPVGVRAAGPVLGFLHSASREPNEARVAAYLQGLADAGFVDGRTVTIVYRWADGQGDRLAAMAEELVRLPVTAIATPGSAAATFAARAATTTIPIVFATGLDPVSLGLVSSLARPGGNLTGANTLNVDTTAKRFALIRELMPQANRFFALSNPTSPLAEAFTREVAAGATALGLTVSTLRASSEAEIETAFAALQPQPGTVLLVMSDAFFYVRRRQLGRLAARHGVAAIYDNRDYAEAGGLRSYGADWISTMRLAGMVTGRVLRGEAPGEIPVVQSTALHLVINLTAARTLGLEIPPLMLARADEVIE